MKNFKFILLFVAALFGFVSCDDSGNKTEPKDPVVELKADKTAIEASGEDFVTFTVYVDKKVATEECLIINLKDNSTLDGYTFATTEEGEYTFKATFGKYASNSVTVNASAIDIDVAPTLTADKSEIKADGVDFVTFTVTDGEDVTTKAKIFNLTADTELEGNTFSTTEAGDYEFIAEYEGNPLKTEIISIKAIAVETPVVPEVVLTADKTTIKADGEDAVTFTVKVDGEAVSKDFEIIDVANGKALESAQFTTTVAGEYKFKAKVGDYESEEVTVTSTAPATEPEPMVVLSADKTTIKADGVDAVTFTVEYENIITEDMPVIINLMDNSEVYGSFTTTKAGTYQFKAIKGGVESNIVTITAKAEEKPDEPTPPSKEYKIGDIYNEGGVKGLVFAFHDKPMFDDNWDVVGTITYGYVMSLDEGYEAWSTENIWVNCTSSGAINTDQMVRAGIDKYPAAKWCINHGEGWFLPSGQEMGWMWNTLTGGTKDFASESVTKYNKLLTDNGGDEIEEAFYWTSGEIDENDAETFAFMLNSVVCDEPYKYKQRDIRAVYMYEVKRTYNE